MAYRRCPNKGKHFGANFHPHRTKCHSKNPPVRHYECMGCQILTTWEFSQCWLGRQCKIGRCVDQTSHRNLPPQLQSLEWKKGHKVVERDCGKYSWLCFDMYSSLAYVTSCKSKIMSEWVLWKWHHEAVPIFQIIRIENANFSSRICPYSNMGYPWFAKRQSISNAVNEFF